jgi:hypothetical protein
MRRLLLLIFVPALALAAAEPSPKTLPEWAKLARKLTGEGDSGRAAVIRKLKAVPDLEAVLRQALEGDEQSLALDAIVALRLTSLYEDVLKASERDRAGFSYLALDALVDPANQARLAQIYRQRLLIPGASPAAKVVMLDSLIRMKERLHPEMLSALLLDDDSPEVRSAALYYLRGYLVTYRDREYLPLLKRVLESELSRQRKVQALSLVSELPRDVTDSLGTVNIACSGDLPTPVQAPCERLRSRTR